MPDDALTRVREALEEGADWCDLLSNEAVDYGAVLRDLLAALDDPARWCGVVGRVDGEWAKDLSASYSVAQRTGRLVVTPHQEGA